MIKTTKIECLFFSLGTLTINVQQSFWSLTLVFFFFCFVAAGSPPHLVQQQAHPILGIHLQLDAEELLPQVDDRRQQGGSQRWVKRTSPNPWGERLGGCGGTTASKRCCSGFPAGKHPSSLEDYWLWGGCKSQAHSDDHHFLWLCQK